LASRQKANELRRHDGEIEDQEPHVEGFESGSPFPRFSLPGHLVRSAVEDGLLGFGELLFAEGPALTKLLEFLELIRDVPGALACCGLNCILLRSQLRDWRRESPR